MHNPFAPQPTDTTELEHEAAAVFGGLGSERLSAEAASSIRESMFAALAATGRTVAMHRRLAVAGSALVAPLIVVGAASAASGESPLAAPATLFEAAAASVGIGGNSGDVRQDIDVRNEAAGDYGQPGSQPGNTENAPGLNGNGGDGEGEDTAPAPEDGEADAAVTPEDKLPPHENEKGCDDVLFANGEPPFASPGGPFGCEVGNSADHRKNGANQDDGEDEPTDEPTDAGTGDDESNGGTSRGLGRGHDDEKPGGGAANGHEVHGHEPNPNGHGPGGPGTDDDGESDPESPATGDPESAPNTGAPGNSGGAPGKNK